MRTDGIFTIHSQCLQVKLDVPIRVIPIGDIHFDSELHADYEFDELLRYIEALKDKYYLLGMGDYNDFVRAHDRAFLKGVESGNIVKALNDYTIQANDNFYEKMEATKGKWIGLMSGNHHSYILNSKRGEEEKTHSDKALADMFKCKYLGTCSKITLTLTSGKQSADVGIIAHHGVGGGSTPGGSINRVKNMLDAWDADIALMGDNHQRSVTPVRDKLKTTRRNSEDILYHQTQWVARTGSFQRGYVPDVESYVVDKALNPSSIGWIEFEFTLKVDPRTKLPYVKIRAIQ